MGNETGGGEEEEGKKGCEDFQKFAEVNSTDQNQS